MQADLFDLSKIKQTSVNLNRTRYERRLEILQHIGQDTGRISTVVDGAIVNIKNDRRSFVIYGEPQSGKTELMIALTARLLDEGYKIIIALMNDSVQLLGQNLERFQRSGLSPAPKKFSEILAPEINLGSREWIIFCKKNAKDLQKLITKLKGQKNIVVLDDEADFATPNSKINRQERSTINDLTSELISNHGIYIGVTATPARLDLNNTHNNVNDHWLDFPSHTKYTGQDVFFPVDISSLPYRLTFTPANQEMSESIQKALFSFMVNVGYLNINNPEENYSLLIHTSGKTSDHSIGYRQLVGIFEAIKEDTNINHAKYLEAIWKLAKTRYPGHEDQVTAYIVGNSERHNLVVMNSDKDVNAADNRTGTSPTSPFTVIIGGNIVSRGVTFDNLLSMLFARDVVSKLQQDTYIQRARMFGARGKYLEYFELMIPEALFLDWQKCFIFHRLSLESRKLVNESPVWLDDNRVTAVAANSIDKARVIVDKGEMSFALFDYPNTDLESIIAGGGTAINKIKQISDLLGTERLPTYLINYIESFRPEGDNSIVVHKTSTISGYRDSAEVDRATITRTRGFMGNDQLEVDKYPDAIHHIKVFENGMGQARVFYKYQGRIRFLKTN